MISKAKMVQNLANNNPPTLLISSSERSRMYFMNSPIGLELTRSLSYSYHILNQWITSIETSGSWCFFMVSGIPQTRKVVIRSPKEVQRK